MICASYCVRPEPGATVSAPLHWDVVKEGLQLSHFTMHNMRGRLRSEGDLCAGVLGKGVDLEDAVQAVSGWI